MLREKVQGLEAKHGADDQYVKLLKQQLAGMELNLHNKNERFLIATGSPEDSEEPQTDVETEEDGKRLGALRAARWKDQNKQLRKKR